MKRPPHFDLANLPEDERIDIIGRAAEAGARVAFIVEDEEKANRYLVKLTSKFQVQVEKKFDGPLKKGTVSVVVVKR